MKVAAYAVGFTFLVYQVVSFAAIFVYGEDISSDVMENVGKEGGVLAYILQSVFLVIAAMHIPVTFFVGKEALLIIIDELRNSSSEVKRRNIDNVVGKSISAKGSIAVRSNRLSALLEQDDEMAYLKMENWLYYAISFLVFALVVAAACTVPDISLVFGIVGATSCSCYLYVIPGAFYLRTAQLAKAEIR